MEKLLVMACVSALLCAGCAPASPEAEEAELYRGRAEEFFDKVWSLYRIPDEGLFSEYYPDSHRHDVDYFEDGARSSQEVSYLWPMDGVFTSAIALARLDPERYVPYVDSMAAAAERYYDDSRLPAGYQVYPADKRRVDRYYDDNGLVGLAYVGAYGVTRDETYLERAKHVMTFIMSGWSEDYGGGVSWLEGVRNQKPCCANGKAMLLALKLYEATGDGYYLVAGRRFYEWIDRYLHDAELDIVWNSWLTEPEGRLDRAVYSYNTGMLLEGAVMLYRLTGEEGYLADARRLAEGGRKFYMGGDAEGRPRNRDIPWFYLVLFRGYHALYEIDGDPRYVDIFIRWMNHAWEHARDDAGLFHNDWSGTSDESRTPKWLLDEACIPEYFARAAEIRGGAK